LIELNPAGQVRGVDRGVSGDCQQHRPGVNAIKLFFFTDAAVKYASVFALPASFGLRWHWRVKPMSN